ncbi:hypothetical protein DPMN_005059 [Dreissena polymorpha]|uniref:Uncharacterized protein n=1 Tax=Dreissena polymorpha TaxID=45954 RepID=A0A9D4MRG0_DREPO|nr:hypothetical protein DPMN_005059 [Dreissena polymorpha]
MFLEPFSNLAKLSTRELTRFYYSQIKKNAQVPRGHISSENNILTKFHKDCTINVTSRVLTRKNTLHQDIIETNVLNKFHEDLTINVASRVFTRQMLTAHNS